jgi:tetratricopeptide (TPR) repeat protein
MGRAFVTTAAGAAIVSLCAFTTPLGAGQRDPTATTFETLHAYRAAVDDYRAKRTQAAITALNSLNHNELADVVERLRALHARQQDRRPAPTDAPFAWDRPSLFAAGMLHVDAALSTTRPDDFTRHALLADTLLRTADEAPNGQRPGAAERRDALAIALLLINGRSDHARQYLDDAIRRLPNDAPLLATSGMVKETDADTLADTTPANATTYFGRLRGVRDDDLHKARTLYERALAADPTLVEARVRLARVMTLEHDDARAAALLDQALASQPPPRWKYMALLLLGGVRERAGRAADAIRLYTAALEAWPDGQSAYISMGHAMFAAGSREEAGEVLEKMFARGLAPTGGADPWWDYQFDDWIHAQELLQALRDEVQP